MLTRTLALGLLVVAASARPLPAEPQPADAGKPASGTPTATPAPDAPPSIDALLAPGAKLHTIASGHRFTEGPAWIAGPGGGRLVYSDIPQDAVFEWSPIQAPDAPDAPKAAEATPGLSKVLVKPSGFSNGLLASPDGSVIAAAHAGRIDVLLPADQKRTLVDAHLGKRLNSPNDLCAGPDGSVYFTDPPYGVRGALGPGGREREMDYSGVYRLTPDGSLTLLNKDLRTPNGIAFSPDFRTLYVADTSGGKIHAFAVGGDGNLGPARVFANVVRAGTDKSAGPDGIKVDAEGRVLCAASDGVRVFDASGTPLGTIATPRGATNLCFGGEGNRTLFITAGSTVFSIELRTPGATLPPPKLPSAKPRSE